MIGSTTRRCDDTVQRNSVMGDSENLNLNLHGGGESLPMHIRALPRSGEKSLKFMLDIFVYSTYLCDCVSH